MSTVGHEFTGRTVEAAIAEGLRQLGLSRDEVEVEIVNEGRRGLLGIGATDARVRIVPLSVSTTDRPHTSATTAAEPAVMPPPSASPPAEPTLSPVDRRADLAPVADEPAFFEERTPPADGASPVGLPAGLVEKELETLATDLLQEMLHHMGVQGEIVPSWQQVEENSEKDETQLVLDIQGKDLGVLIGRQGETLASIQYLLRLMVNQKLHLWTNIVVDVEQYKQRRADRLGQMAQRLAEQVVNTGKPVVLEPMSPSDRRLVHLALRDHPRVHTKSIGEGDRRKVQILLNL